MSKVENVGSATWASAETHCRLLVAGQWVTVSAPARTSSRGEAPAPKKSIGEILDALQWESDPGGGPKVAYFANFLKKLKIPAGTPGKRAVNLNKLLTRAGYTNTLKTASLGKAGSPPWVGTRLALRNAYRFL